MSPRRRDARVAELLVVGLMATLSIRLSFLCFSRWVRGSSIILTVPTGLILPLWIWGVLWGLSAVGLLYGFFVNRFRVSEYSSLLTALLWFQTIYWTLHSNSILTLRLGWAIIFSVFSVLVYLNKARAASNFRKQARGRSGK